MSFVQYMISFFATPQLHRELVHRLSYCDCSLQQRFHILFFCAVHQRLPIGRFDGFVSTLWKKRKLSIHRNVTKNQTTPTRYFNFKNMSNQIRPVTLLAKFMVILCSFFGQKFFHQIYFFKLNKLNKKKYLFNSPSIAINGNQATIMMHLTLNFTGQLSLTFTYNVNRQKFPLLYSIYSQKS